MPLTFDQRVQVPADVLVSELDGEAVLLNLKTESYFGLDDVGARMWAVVTTAESIEAGFNTLKGEYDVEPEQLRKDLGELLEKLLAEGLLEIPS